MEIVLFTLSSFILIAALAAAILSVIRSNVDKRLIEEIRALVGDRKSLVEALPQSRPEEYHGGRPPVSIVKEQLAAIHVISISDAIERLGYWDDHAMHDVERVLEYDMFEKRGGSHSDERFATQLVSKSPLVSVRKHDWKEFVSEVVRKDLGASPSSQLRVFELTKNELERTGRLMKESQTVQ